MIDKTKQCFIDYLGVSIRGAREPEARIVRRAVPATHFPKGISTVFGSEIKTDSLYASLCNGISAHCLELDDTHREAIIHCAAPIISAALSVAESIRASGKELLMSVVAGYEVAIRASLPIIISHRDRGFHSTGTCGIFGAARRCRQVT